MIKIKIILLNRGVSISNSAQKYFHEYPFDKGFDNITITLKNYDIVVSCPVMMNLNALSPFEIDYVDNNLILLFNGKFLTELDVLFQNPMDKIFLPNSTKNFSKISYLGPDRLRITYFSGCKLKTGNGGCKFCRVQPFSSAHTNHEIAETIKAYSNNKSVRHFLIGGGSDYSNIGYEEIHRVLSELKKENKPIYLMTTPPQDINELKKIKSLGVTEVGFNIEIFDRKKAKELMPIKGAIDLDRYYKAFAEAVKLFGKGSVYCAFIVGIESENTLLQGIEKVCSLGVYPILSLYRETVGSNLNIITPSDDNLECLYNKILQICNKYGVELGPKCKICKNNVIAI